MPAMVSQSQENDWESPSRTGSMLSLDGRQRPPTAKTPPSYYDAVRSRHSLSQPVNKSPESLKQEKSLHVQQVKYNSLPRPLPQRFPPVTNGQPLRNPWAEPLVDHYDPNRSNCGMRQQYDSPPKPANRVPLPLQVHQEKSSPMKRGIEQAESSGFGVARGGPRQPTEKLTVDCSPRGNVMDPLRKDGVHYIRPDIRPPPPVPGRRPPQLRGATLSNGMDCSNSIPKRDNTQNSGLLRRCYPIPSNSSAPSPGGFPPNTRPVIDASTNYEPRYSKSGKLCPRPFNQEARPMPPPVVMLRTGPLGTYPDHETLKRSEMASAYNRQQERNGTGTVQERNGTSMERQYHRPLSQGDVSQQIFVDTNSYTNGQPMPADHLAIPYRIPQVSPKNSRSVFEGSQTNGMGMKKEPLSLPCNRPQSSPSLRNSSPSGDFKSRTLPRDSANSSMDYRSRRQEPSHFAGNPYDTRDVPRRNSTHNDGRTILTNDVIYANQQLPYHNGGNGYLPDQQRSPPAMNGNGPLYENSQPRNGLRDPQSRNNIRDSQDTHPQHSSRNSLQDENLYANHHIATTHYNQQAPFNHHQPPSNNHQPLSGFENKQKNARPDRRNTHPPPPVAQKPSPNLPQPSEMMMITEIRGWNGQASSMYAKDVVKPTPRMPRLPNGVLASNAQLATVPAYQCVINELSSHPLHHISSPQTTNSSTLSLRSEYDSSSSSSRDFGRRPSKSDSGTEPRRTSESCLKPAIGKSLLSASMTSLCSDASSSISSRLRQNNEDSSWERMNDDNQNRKDKNSIFSASPWDREKKEKLQQEQVLDARRARDQEIAWLESISEDRRTEKQSEWLRILRLEREFQRRAEQEPDDDDDVCSSEDDSSDDTTDGAGKMANFPRDKLTVIPNERIGLKLLDELLDTPSKTSTSPVKERDLKIRSPSEKHFIPLDLAIPDNELQPCTLPLTNNILKISSEHPPDFKEVKSSKPPVPAPRPSKTYTPVSLSDAHRSPEMITENEQSVSSYPDMDNNVSSLAKLDISDSSAFFCSIENGDHSSRSTPQDNWLIEVPNNFVEREEARPDGAFSRNDLEHKMKQQNETYEATLMDHRLKQKNEIRDETAIEQMPKQQNGMYETALLDQRQKLQNGVYIRDEALLREQKLKQHNGMYEAVVVEQNLKQQSGTPHRVEAISMKNQNDEQSRIYENIKPADYHYLRTQTISGSSFTSHTLPKTTTNNSSLVSRSPPRNGSRPHDKKFPIMGVSSTLTKKGNGFVPSDADILPSLYASCKAQQNGYVKEVPSDLVDKSPEFKKMWISRPEKLTFQDKIRKFSLQAGEDDLPRDRVKNSRAQREIENKFVESQRRPGSQKATDS